MPLKPVKSLPLRRRTVREAELSEYSLKIILVKITDVPEYGLISPVAGRHVHGMHNLLEIVVDDLYKGPLLDIQLHHLIKTVDVVIPIVLADEVVKIHKELRSGHGTHEL